MNCPNCGRELAEGEVCTCIPQPEQVVNENENAQQNTYTEPQFQQQAPQFQAPPQFQPPQGAYYVPPQGAYYQPAPPEAPVAAKTDYPEGYKIKRKYVAVILAATLGAFGIHNFYLGDSNKAIIHILVASLGSIVCGLGLVASAVWAIVEAVQLLTESIDRDANGYKIQTFEEALVKELKANDE